MQTVSTVTLEKNQEATDFSQAKSAVIVEGKPTGIEVPGQVLEAAVKVDTHRYLIFITDDVVFEEALTIVLIDINLGLLETLHLGNEYASGYFEELTTTGNSVSFKFIGDTTWTINVSESPLLHIPFLSDPSGVKRTPGLKKYLSVTANPTPAKLK